MRRATRCWNSPAPVAEVHLEALRHRYPGADRDTLAGLDLRIARGEAHALLGSSGAGKSTLVNLLSGLLEPSSGAIRFDGRDVSAVRPRERNVAQVFQFPVLYDALKVEEILAFPLRNRGWTRRDAARRAAEIGERLHLGSWFGVRAKSLPLFQKQLVAIARALVRPDIAVVLLDEPLTAVEPAVKWQLRRAIKAIQGELGATMVYVTHDQTEALTFADRISVMHDGHILQTGSPERLYNLPDHEYVGHFIGSPGMNLLAGCVRRGSLVLAGRTIAAAPGMSEGSCTIGFRPEWAKLASGPPARGSERGHTIEVRVTGTRVLGIRGHRRTGIVSAALGEQVIRTRQVIDVAEGELATLEVDPARVLAFRDGVRLESAL